MKLPERQSLVSQTIKIIQKMIKDGKLVSPLMGERRLAEKLQIGRDTLRTALKELEQKHWISNSLHGKRRTILVPPEQSSSMITQQNVAILSPRPLEQLASHMVIEFDTLRAHLANQDILLEIVTPSVFNTDNPYKKLDTMIKEHSADVWILYRCTPQIQEWFQEHEIPCIIRGYPHPNISLPYLDEDWTAAAFHATNNLINNGHQEIALLVPNQPLQGLKAAELGIREAVEKSQLDISLHVLLEDSNKQSVLNAISRGLEKNPNITALIITRPRQLLNTITWLAQHRLRIPEHLSIVALSYEPWFDEIIPAINYYLTPQANLAKTLSRRLTTLLQGTTLNAHASLMIPEAIKGQSIKKMN